MIQMHCISFSHPPDRMFYNARIFANFDEQEKTRKRRKREKFTIVNKILNSHNIVCTVLNSLLTTQNKERANVRNKKKLAMDNASHFVSLSMSYTFSHFVYFMPAYHCHFECDCLIEISE